MELSASTISKKPDFAVSIDAKTIAHVLRAVPVGSVIAYTELSRAIARDVCASGRGAMNTARALVQREDRMVFDTVHKKGLKRLADEEIVGLGDRARDHVRRASRKIIKKLTCVDYDTLSKEKQTKHNTSLSMFGVFCELATDKSTKRLSACVEAAQVELPVAKASIAALGLTL